MDKHDDAAATRVPHDEPGDQARRRVSRRTLVKSAAWAVPVVAAAAAAPAYAASICAGSGSQIFNPTPSSSPIATTFTVPAGVTTLRFVVAGGGGGSTTGTDGTVPGGQGALVTGTVAVTPGEELTIYAAEGGESTRSSSSPTATATGGRGFGAGGVGGSHSSNVSPATWMPGAAGGGGSAIVRGFAPLVVAGGGGGASGQNLSSINGTVELIDTHGGDADHDGPTLVYDVDAAGTANDVTATAAGGSRGSGGTGGNLKTSTGAWTKGPVFSAGGDGGRAGGSGGDGGRAVLVAAQVGTNNWVVSGGGGGGGGYQGGGGGESVAATKQVNGAWAWGAFGGNGGGGQSFVASGVSADIGLTGTRTNSATRTNGYVKLSWEC